MLATSLRWPGQNIHILSFSIERFFIAKNSLQTFFLNFLVCALPTEVRKQLKIISNRASPAGLAGWKHEKGSPTGQTGNKSFQPRTNCRKFLIRALCKVNPANKVFLKVQTFVICSKVSLPPSGQMESLANCKMQETHSRRYWIHFRAQLISEDLSIDCK